jgi:site-specific recombinase XerD
MLALRAIRSRGPNLLRICIHKRTLLCILPIMSPESSPVPTSSLTSLLAGYEDMSLSPATRAEYARDVAAFLTWLRGRALTPETLIHYRDELQGSGRGASSVNRALAAVRSSLKALARETLNGKQAAVVGTVLAGVHGVKKVSSPVTEARMLTPEEREKILACSSSRLGCILKFLYATGARVSEAVGVRLSDCTEVGEIVLVRLTGKGNKEREVRVGRELLEEIRAVYDGETYLFETSGGKPLRREYVTHCLHRVALQGDWEAELCPCPAAQLCERDDPEDGQGRRNEPVPGARGSGDHPAVLCPRELDECRPGTGLKGGSDSNPHISSLPRRCAARHPAAPAPGRSRFHWPGPPC